MTKQLQLVQIRDITSLIWVKNSRILRVQIQFLTSVVGKESTLKYTKTKIYKYVILWMSNTTCCREVMIIWLWFLLLKQGFSTDVERCNPLATLSLKLSSLITATLQAVVVSFLSHPSGALCCFLCVTHLSCLHVKWMDCSEKWGGSMSSVWEEISRTIPQCTALQT